MVNIVKICIHFTYLIYCWVLIKLVLNYCDSEEITWLSLISKIPSKGKKLFKKYKVKHAETGEEVALFEQIELDDLVSPGSQLL